MQALKALVVGMGVLILFGVAVIGVTIYRRADDPSPAASGATAPPAVVRQAVDGAFGVRDLDLPAGTEVVAVVGAGSRVVLHLRAPDGQARLLVLDPASGTQLGEWRVTPSTSTPAPAPSP